MASEENHHKEGENEMQKQRWEAWHAQDETVKKLSKGAEGFFADVPDKEKLFVLQDRYLRCVDEGTPGGIHTPGSQILVSDMGHAVEEIRAAGITAITSHDGCGAAAAAGKDGKTFAQELAERAGLPHIHISSSEMQRPDFHDARVIYYDGSGSFNWNRVPGVPKGFVVSVPHFNSAPASLELCAQIATGHHGFGEMFTAENPLVVVVIGSGTNRRYSVNELSREARKVLIPFGDRIRVTAFETSAQDEQAVA